VSTAERYSHGVKRLEQLVSATVARRLVTKLRSLTEELFEPPRRGSSIEEIRDNLWDLYLSGDLESSHPPSVVAAARREYLEIFEVIAQGRGHGRDVQLRRRFMTQLAHALVDVAGYKKIDPPTYVPTKSDLAKIKRATIPPELAFIDLANQLTGLEHLTVHGNRERQPGLTRALIAELPAPALRNLTLDGAASVALEGAIANPRWPALTYLALYDTKVSKAQLAAALARWTSLETLAIRAAGAFAVRTLDVIAPAAPRLVELALVDTQLADAAIRTLLCERPWPALKRLYLSGNALSTATAKQLKRHLPKAKLA
jgi:plasmid stabilization system protein ParE